MLGIRTRQHATRPIVIKPEPKSSKKKSLIIIKKKKNKLRKGGSLEWSLETMIQIGSDDFYLREKTLRFDSFITCNCCKTIPM
jgi:hypothetical protein